TLSVGPGNIGVIRDTTAAILLHNRRELVVHNPILSRLSGIGYLVPFVCCPRNSSNQLWTTWIDNGGSDGFSKTTNRLPSAETSYPFCGNGVSNSGAGAPGEKAGPVLTLAAMSFRC